MTHTTDEELDALVTEISNLAWSNADVAAAAITALRTQLAEVQAVPEVRALVEALQNIARQKKSAQIEEYGETEFADFEGAYDMCIDVARAALAPFTKGGDA